MRAAGQGAAVPHMGAHALGAAAYAARAVALASPDRPEAAGEEIAWQLSKLSAEARSALLQLPSVGRRSCWSAWTWASLIGAARRDHPRNSGWSHRRKPLNTRRRHGSVMWSDAVECDRRGWRRSPVPGRRKRGLRTAARREPHCIGGVAGSCGLEGTPELQLQHEAGTRHSKEWKIPPRRRAGRVQRRRPAPELPSAHQMAVCTSEWPLPFVNVRRWAFDRP